MLWYFVENSENIVIHQGDIDFFSWKCYNSMY